MRRMAVSESSPNGVALALARPLGTMLRTANMAPGSVLAHGWGRTGLTPADVRRFVEDRTRAEGRAPDQLILGGDHLRPNPWRHLPADQAMDRARAMIGQYVAAGLSKIHIDAAIPCGG